MTRIIIVRHGETGENREHIIQGQLDTPLNAQGEAQVAEFAEILHKREPEIDAVYSSTLVRAYKSAEIIAGDKIPVYGKDGFRERYMGELEGMTRQEAVTKRNRDGRWSLLQYGESADALVARLTQAWDDLLEECKERDYKNVVLVTHGGAMYQLFKALRQKKNYGGLNRMALFRVQSDPKIVNCSVTIVNTVPLPGFEVYAETWVDSIVRERDQL